MGSIITFRYQELSNNGVPRFPSFVREREDAMALTRKKEQIMAMPAKRRFECVEGTSQKFWEVSIEGPRMKVTFGRIGTAGQTDVTNFEDAQAALHHAERKVREKLRKAYTQVA